MTVNRKRAPLRSSTYAASAPLNRVLSGTSTPPAPMRAERGDHPLGDVRRPDADAVAGLEPAAMNARAVSSIRAASSGNVMRSVAVDQALELGEPLRTGAHQRREWCRTPGRPASSTPPPLPRTCVKVADISRNFDAGT